ncbi:hypothetical protein LTR10_019502 [Elasticomyces elasticus]|uniref:NAD(P)-binding domain-containing protein n=1 Tax=Exophiala sideris TaxID=1016849 RepID=A0ABR0JKB6_9EURO|nr:hypothetical protein LTR10_019502 [Elasticomyces elasticus]KAK5035493.1 hypothetical protein LTS07_002932 [Exophiala sideris]KAK5039155.1 hypothetical protein LTR13_003411 [Exophiala sideris]KAK5066418.1 hypothetical protein LTR69_002938 [Exophiala sideris]KAK5187095.1 hypothetical protein LTR44_001103 [Eurotiomycetes sp. CCFEE 6388]
MAQQYAKDQPHGFKNHVENIAVVGAGGRIGEYIAKELVKGGKHKVTAITRPDSTSKLPEGLHIVKVDYNNPSTLVDALRGQDALIITMAVTAPPDTETKIVQAAAEAGVPWIMANDWGVDYTNPDVARDTMLGERRHKVHALIESLGKSSWISLVCGFWYDFSLGGSPARYGFDFGDRSLTLFDDGNTKINHSTWEQCGRAVANLFSLKVLPDDASDKSPTISQFRNNYVYISSFLASQRDMFDSVLRVTGTSEKDWTIKHEDVKERYKKAVEDLKSGNMEGFVRLLYSRVFYPDGSGNHEASKGLHNDVLGLPKEDLDERTKIAIERGEKGLL